MSVPAVAALEIVRFFRRRSTVWVFAAGLVFVAGAYLLAAMLLGWMRPYYPGLEIMNRVLIVMQLIGLCGASWVIARRSIVSERTSGSFPLLAQTPIRGSRILFGKAVGLSAILLFGHSWFALVVMLPTPLIRRPHWVFFAYLFLGWLLAISIIPAGFADGLVEPSGARRWLRHISWIARLVVPVVVLQMAIVADSKAFGFDISDVVLQFVGNVLGSSSASAADHFGGPVTPIVVISVCFAVLAILDWRRAVRLIRR